MACRDERSSGKYFVDSYSRVESPPVTTLRSSATGAVLRKLEEADVSRLKVVGWRAAQVFNVKARDGITDIYGVLYLPPNIDSTKKYPIISHIYPGPQVGSVGSWSFKNGGEPFSLAELGFVVIQLDHLGTPLRSKAFHDNYYGFFGDNGLPDHIAAIKQLGAKHGFIDTDRVGIFGHGSVLTLTSHANRTSPVLRGKWVMEVLMGTPPPAPPPNVPDLEKTGDSKEGRMLTTRERMEEHRANPSCRSCHVFIDPIGLAMDNFDVNGQWRIRENGTPLDTRGDFYDGTKITNALELQKALLKRPTPLVRNFTQNLMAYALGRRVEYYDHPAVRKIEAQVKANNYRMQDFIVGVVKSDAFRLKKVMEQADSGTKGASAPGVR